MDQTSEGRVMKTLIIILTSPLWVPIALLMAVWVAVENKDLESAVEEYK
jgi:hypothetical protein